jgi:two-component system sensor histidine kinase GlrK
VSQSLLAQITDMERNARQYHVLQDSALLESYANRHQQFQETATQLADLAENDFLQNQLEVLTAKENVLFRVLQQEPDAPLDTVDPVEEFMALTRLGDSIVKESHSWINSQVNLLSDMADKAQTLLVGQAIGLVPGTLIFAILLTSMIARPIREIDHAIRQLGNGEFEQAITVKGPRDLQYLGQRLDWLRVRLIELEEKKTSFMQHVSHELKTPLTAIREGSALLAEGLLGHLSEQQKEVTRVLQRNCLQLQKMIENLLNFNMVQSKKTALKIGDVRLDQVVEDVAADHKLALLAKQIDVRISCGKVRMHGDREKLRVVIDNLFSNAIKYSPDQSQMDVTLNVDGNTAVFDIVDSGPGIDAQDLDKVFHEFYRGHSTPKGDIRGSGLGLSIAREFVHVHHGAIEVVSDPDHVRGAHFRVTLPLHQDKFAA